MPLFKRSYLGLLVLRLLDQEPEAELYGYRIAKLVNERTQGEYQLPPGALYPTLRALKQAQFIERERRKSPHGPDRFYYRLTPKGRVFLKDEMAALEEALRLLGFMRSR